MANGIEQYSMDASRLSAGLLTGFTLSPNGSLLAQEDTLSRTLFLPALDSVQPDCQWGRLSLKVQLKGDTVLTIYALALNEPCVTQAGGSISLNSYLLDAGRPSSLKFSLLSACGASVLSGAADSLLYQQTGRYLWLALEVSGPGCAVLDQLRVLVPGDNFYHTLPAVYQDNDFLHRYLSIFSSLYSDLQDTIDHLDRYLDLDTAPAGLLPVFAGWLGIELGGNFLDDSLLRRLLKAAPSLLASKGTRRAIELITRLFVEEPFYLVEYNLLAHEQRTAKTTLYGQSPYDFTLLINRAPEERLWARLDYFINQFKPAYSRAKIIFLGGRSGLDGYCYLDINASLLQPAPGPLDGGCRMGFTYLK